MKYILLEVFNNYIDANIIAGRLQEENIECMIADENTATIYPIISSAIGGIKLMVPEPQAERALSLLREYKADAQHLHPCPKCGSKNIEFVTTPRKPGNWFSVLLGLFVLSYAMPVEKVYHCFNCGNEFNDDKSNAE